MTHRTQSALRHLSLRFVAMLFGKGTKPLPIGDPWLAACLGIHLGSEAASRRFTLESQVDGVTTDAKDATGFPLPHPIQFDGIDDFLAQIKTIGFRHGTQGERSIFLAYILTNMATSIIPNSNLDGSESFIPRGLYNS